MDLFDTRDRLQAMIYRLRVRGEANALNIRHFAPGRVRTEVGKRVADPVATRGRILERFKSGIHVVVEAGHR